MLVVEQRNPSFPALVGAQQSSQSEGGVYRGPRVLQARESVAINDQSFGTNGWVALGKHVQSLKREASRPCVVGPNSDANLLHRPKRIRREATFAKEHGRNMNATSACEPTPDFWRS